MASYGKTLLAVGLCTTLQVMGAAQAVCIKSGAVRFSSAFLPASLISLPTNFLARQDALVREEALAHQESKDNGLAWQRSILARNTPEDRNHSAENRALKRLETDKELSVLDTIIEKLSKDPSKSTELEQAIKEKNDLLTAALALV